MKIITEKKTADFEKENGRRKENNHDLETKWIKIKKEKKTEQYQRKYKVKRKKIN